MTRSLKGPKIQRLKSQPAPAAQSQSEGVYGTAIMRTNAGINKTEHAGRKDAQIGFVDALQRVFPTAVAKVSRMSWLDSPRDLVQRNIGNI